MTRARTADRGPTATSEIVAPGGSAPIHAEQISETRSRLPNGNLLCRNVPVTRVGFLIYGPGEVPVKPGPDGLAYVERTADTLFTPQTIGSINGAALTIGHPSDDVTPANWKSLSHGFAINARRGHGADHDVILADFVVTHDALIRDIEAGLVEVSLGYDASYLDKGGGIGQQFNIVGNHIAFVPKGRCGPRCAIGDESFSPPAKKERHMPTQAKTPPAARRTLDRETLLEAAKQRAADAAAEIEALSADDGAQSGTFTPAPGGPGHGIVINLGAGGGGGGSALSLLPSPARTADARLDALESGMAQLIGLLTKGKAADVAPAAGVVVPPAKTADESYEDDDESDEAIAWRKKRDEDKKKTDDAAAAAAEGEGAGKTRDSAALATSYSEMIAQAEVLVPGFKVPTFDAACPRAKTVERMCAARRKALDQAYGTADGKLVIEAANGGKPFDCVSMDCAATAVLFKAAVAGKAAANNAAATRDSATQVTVKAFVPPPVGAKTPAEINAINAKFWEGQ